MTTFLANLHLRAIAVRDREEGQAMAEYGIIVALIAVVCIAAVGVIGVDVNSAFNKIGNALVP